MIRTFYCLFLYTLLYSLIEAQDFSSQVLLDSNDCLLYRSDSEGNRIPDFSQVGYKLGKEVVPFIEVVKTISPIAGDNTEHLQDAIDMLATLPLDSSGHRGALLLEPGVYEIHGIIRIQHDGIVLRGAQPEGNDSFPTKLIGMGNIPDQRDLIVIGGLPGSSWRNAVAGSHITLTSTFLPVGSRTLEVSNTVGLTIGDKIIIQHPSTEAWLQSIDFGGTGEDENWAPGEIDIYYNRRIEEIFPDQNKIRIDVPLYDHLDRDLSTTTVYLWDDKDIVRECGIENLEIIINTNGINSEDHVWTAVRLDGVEDCWVKRVHAEHFAYAAVNMTTATRVTVDNCRGLNPHSRIEGARRYNFAVNREANNILFTKCLASYGRHAYVSNGASSASGIVFYNCQASFDQTSSEGHRRWSQGLLFDNVRFTSPQTNRVLGLYNRGSFGTGHGWSAVHSVAWNVSVEGNRDIIIQKPPLRQNYAIGCLADVSALGPFKHDQGFIELTNRQPLPSSLYEAQRERSTNLAITPDAPARLQLTSEGNSSIKLEWLDIAAHESGYQIEASEDGNSYEYLVDLPANVTSYTFSLDSTKAFRHFRIFAMGPGCQSAYSNEVFTELSTRLDAVGYDPILVMPNPAKDRIFISGTNRWQQIFIYDIMGRLRHVESGGISRSQEINIKPLNGGLYFLVALDASSRTSVGRFIKE